MSEELITTELKELRSDEDLRLLLADCRRYPPAVEQLKIDSGTPPIEVVALSKTGVITLYVNNAPNLEILVDGQTMVHLNLMKSVIIEQVKSLKNPLIAIAFLLSLLSNKQRNQYITSINRLGSRIIKEDILKAKHMSAFSNEVEYIAFELLKMFGIEEVASHSFAEICSHITEHDSAYRFILKDLFSESSLKQFTDNPFKEMRRLLKIYKQREEGNSVEKISIIANFVSLLALIPKYRKAIIEVFRGVEFKNLQRTKEDEYWMYYKAGYKVMGMTKDEHRKYIVSIFGIKPKFRA